LLPAHHPQMQGGLRVARLQAQSLGELSRGRVRLSALLQHSAAFIAQVRPVRLKFDRRFEFRTCFGEITSKTRDASQSSMCFRVFRGQANSLARFGFGILQVSTLCQGVGKINAGLREIWFQTKSDAKL